MDTNLCTNRDLYAALTAVQGHFRIKMPCSLDDLVPVVSSDKF